MSRTKQSQQEAQVQTETTSASQPSTSLLPQTALDFARQAEKLSLHAPANDGQTDGLAVEALFPARYDPVVVTSDGARLPAVPLDEAHKLNILREQVAEGEDSAKVVVEGNLAKSASAEQKDDHGSSKGNLRTSIPPTHTNPLFPPLPLYGPPTLLRQVQCGLFRLSSFFLSLAFLQVIVLGSLFTSIGPFCQRMWKQVIGQDPDAHRPFIEEERRREQLRRGQAQRLRRRRSSGGSSSRPAEGLQPPGSSDDDDENDDIGADKIVCDVGYYARRVGLDVEEFQIETEDGFIIDLWHVYDPKEYSPLPAEERRHLGPEVFTRPAKRAKPSKGGGDSWQQQKPKFPVLLIHGLLQSAGAYCVNDEDSLAFYLCKSGYDVWLGNNRCGFNPQHTVLKYSDPRMWCWNIRQMGVFDLPALTSRVLYETGFDKIGLICHSQGTTQTLVALAKEQRPELGQRLTVFCALAPAAYAGPLIGKMYFKFMRVITPAMFRLLFGIHAFIPIMMTSHRMLPPKIYGWLGYKVFSFLFDWTDTRWDRALRNRMFQFAPVYVSAESMRWWLGRECFANHKCILATKEEWRAEEREMENWSESDEEDSDDKEEEQVVEMTEKKENGVKEGKQKGSRAWYNHQAPPFALWVCGNDRLVDGEKLLRRFEKGSEPHVDVVHSTVLEGYEHLDVIWAMDAVEKVFKDVRDVLWKTCHVRDQCRVPFGCEDVDEWVHPGRTET
ncbi:sterol esterase [Rhypophila decipiens]|uniref:Sterol esterase n=1 Tax=Rhypophila decipiens TaxID=261697 RepID=A0AAN6YGM5_9PEZI|nr:sterol esterase [Rhypophila decipiens]